MARCVFILSIVAALSYSAQFQKEGIFAAYVWYWYLLGRHCTSYCFLVNEFNIFVFFPCMCVPDVVNSERGIHI